MMTSKEFLESKGINTLTVNGFQTDNTKGKQTFWTAFTILEEFARIKCEEQKKICADHISEEDKSDSLIYEQTEAIRNLVKLAPEPNF